jgi:hypothetical protein
MQALRQRRIETKVTMPGAMRGDAAKGDAIHAAKDTCLFSRAGTDDGLK